MCIFLCKLLILKNTVLSDFVINSPLIFSLTQFRKWREFSWFKLEIMFLKPSIAVGTSITNVFDTYTCVDLNGNNLSALNLGFCGIIRRIPERLKKLQDCDKMRVRSIFRVISHLLWWIKKKLSLHSWIMMTMYMSSTCKQKAKIKRSWTRLGNVKWK